MGKEINKEIAEFLKGYRHISEIGERAIFIYDVKGNIFDVNKSAERLTGYSRRKLLKMNVCQLHPKKERKTSRRQLRIIDKLKRRISFKSVFLKKNGRMIKVRIVADKFRFKRKYFVIDLVTKIKDRKIPKPFKKPIIEKLDKKFARKIRRLDREYIESLRLLIDVVEAKDPHTMKHSAKVTDHAIGLANYLGLPKKDIEVLKLSAMLHDIGKVGIKKSILLKPSRLTEKEYEEIKRHPQLSVDIMKPLHFTNGMIPIIKHHHENYDGTGYPDGLKGEGIPLGARILAVVDVYDALTSNRAYRKAYSPKKALEIMYKEDRDKFDPVILKKFTDYLSFKKRKRR